MFVLLFEYLQQKTYCMQYWKGEKQTEKETLARFKAAAHYQVSTYSRPGPDNKLPLKHEFLLIIKRLRLGLLVYGFAIRF